MKYVIGLDLGTTTIKATVFDETGAFVSDASVERQLILPGNGWIEQDAEEWFADAAHMIRCAVEKGDIPPEDVAALSISSQGITIVPVDAAGRPLANAINWMDLRPAAQSRALLEKISAERIGRITGKDGTSLAYSILKIMWFRDEMPQVFEKAARFLMPMDYVLMRMTGNAVTDHSMAAGSMCYSLQDKTWSDEILAAAGIGKELFPPICWAGESAGHLTQEAAKRCGLTEKTIAVVGGQDQKVAAYGARGDEDGVVTLSLGTCGCFEFMTNSCEKPGAGPDLVQLPLCPHVVEGKWTLEACMNTSGGAIKWMRDVICAGLSYDEMDALAEEAEPGSSGVLFYPYLAGSGNPHPNQNDQTGSFRGLKLETGRPQLLRAMFEGIAYECRMNIEEAEKAVPKIRRINAFSGGSKAEILCRIIADVTGCEVCAYSYPEMGNLGAARLAAAGAGLDAEAFGAGLLAEHKIYIPSVDSQLYKELYGQYLVHSGE